MAKADDHSSDQHKCPEPETEKDLLRSRQTIGFVRDLAGRALNQGLNILVGKNVEKEYLGVVSTDLARRYVRGREILATLKPPGNLASLSADDRLAVRTYLKVHDDLPASLPFYDKKTLIADLDRELSRKVEAGQSKSTGKPQPLPASAENNSAGSKTKVQARNLKDSALPVPTGRHNVAADQEKRGVERKVETLPAARDKKAIPKVGEDSPGPGPDKSSLLWKALPQSAASPGLKSGTTSDSPNSRESDSASADWRSRVRAGLSSSPASRQSTRPEGARAPENSEDLPGGPRSTGMQANTKAELNQRQGDGQGSPGVQKLAASIARAISRGPWGEDSHYKSDSISQVCRSSRQVRPNSAALNSPTPNQKPAKELTRELRRELTREPTKELTTNVTEAHTKAPTHSGSGPGSDQAQSAIPAKKEGQEKLDSTCLPAKSASPSKSQILSVFRSEKASPRRQSPPLEMRKTISAPGTVRRATDGHCLEIISEKSESVVAGQRSYIGRPAGLIRPWQSHIADHIEQDMLAVSDNFCAGPRASIRLKEPAGESGRELQDKVVFPRRLVKVERRHFLTGPELAFAAIIALAAAARARPEQSELFQEQTRLIDPVITSASSYAELPENPMQKSQGEDLSTSRLSEKLKLTEPDDWHAAPDSMQAERPRAKGKTALRPKILIGKADTLVSIAEDIFGDPQLAWLILDINTDSLTVLVMDQRYIVRLRSRQELFLPVYDDILSFTCPTLSAAVNLITVVDECQIDRQLLDQAFDPLLGGTHPGDELAVKQFGDLTIVDED